jgi:hypothetical protein
MLSGIYFDRADEKVICTLTSAAKPRFTKGIQYGEKLWITLCTNVGKFSKQARPDSSTLFIQTGFLLKYP